ncbi:unnamed protein product [Brachionus calyciflorus]|uniref:Uncharacterized protein n=1 Tax=Brachionus calyciflorus TaxID=104777 RepID=A0A813RHR1_9BILA|nr:unnamed protein product [Brachionus calyciflorus]
MSFNSNIKSKINALNDKTKANNVANKPNIKVSNSISEKIKKLSTSSTSSNESTPSLGTLKKVPKEALVIVEEKDLVKDKKEPDSSSIKTRNETSAENTKEIIIENTKDASNNKNSVFKNELAKNEEISNKNSSDNNCFAEEEDSSISNESNNLTNSNRSSISELDDLESIKKKLAEYQYINKQLRLENDTLHEELHDIRNEMEELQDQFRLDDADEFRQLQAELEIAAKNCRILQFKLRKLEKRNESLETDKLILQDKLDEFSREANKIIDLEEELLIAKEVSIRLNGELEQAHEWKQATERLNKELKKQLDDLKDYLDNEIKSRGATQDYNEMVLVNKLYESMFREYFLQEQLYSVSNSSQTQNVSTQLREVNDLMNSYQQKIALLNEEIDILKIQLMNKEKEMEQIKIQLKNLKRSRSSDSGYDRNRRQLTPSNNGLLNGKANSNMSLDTSGNLIINSNTNNSDLSRDSSSCTITQIQMANDEIKLLKNKIARLEDDLMFVTQEKENLMVKLENIENKAMKSFTQLEESERDNTESDAIAKSMEKQMSELRKKIEILNIEAKENEEIKTQLAAEIKQLKMQVDNKISNDNLDKTIKKEDSNKNLTDSDKLLRDECNKLRAELDNKNESINKYQSELKSNFAQLNELKKMIEIKEAKYNDSIQNEAFLNRSLDDTKNKLYLLNGKLEEYEQSLANLKLELSSKVNIEAENKIENKRLNSKINDLNSQIKEKMSEIEFLNKENNALQERLNSDEQKIKNSEDDMKKLKFKMDDLQRDLDLKTQEVVKLEKLIKSKENEFGDMNKRLTWKEQIVKDKLEQFEKNKKELHELHKRYAELSANHEDKLNSLNKEVQRLNKEKDDLSQNLDDLKKSSLAKSERIENEIQNEKMLLQKIETETLTLKYETKIQYLDAEIETYRSKIKKLIKEKEIQDQVLKENQKLVKEIALKYATDSDAWNRQKQKLLEKEKLYEESVDMRRELKKAADKLRHKLQTLEEQIIENQNKHTIEKNNWESQRLQYISQNNKLEEQLSRLSTLKRSKKEIDFAWDKERKEFVQHIKSLECFISDLQMQLAAKNSNANNSVNEQYGQNDKIQSLHGENEFLKNRIRELEVMLEEMEQVKRFLFDVKEAYDADRLEWIYAKNEFRNQIEIKESLLIDCNMKLNEILNVVRAIQLNEPIPANFFSLGNGKDSICSESSQSSRNQTLNNLVGGTSTLLDFKFGSKTSELNQCDIKMINNNTQFKYLNNNEEEITDPNDLSIVDITKDRKDLDSEFDQAFKKINRVRDNLSTHKKFMDIVKSKSMKALNRKSSITSLPMTEIATKHESRASVPPENKLNETIHASQRAKSVSKEPGSRDSSVFAPSRFFSLGRRFAKIRFSSSSQPPPPEKSQIEQDELKSKKSSKMTQSQLIVPTNNTEEDKKKNLRERALSPSRILRSLRPRSPFNRTNRNVKANSLAPTTTTIGTSEDISGKNKSFTVNVGKSSEEPLVSKKPKNDVMSASYHSGTNDQHQLNRFVRANTAQPSEKVLTSSPNEKLKSLSCEFIDNQSTTSSILSVNSKNNGLKQVNEILDEYDELDNNSIITGSSYSANQQETNKDSTNKKINNSSTSTSKVEMLRKNFMENSSPSQNSEIIKSVKFREPEKSSSESEGDSQKVEKKSRFEEAQSKMEYLSQARLKSSVSATNVDKPPKAPAQTFNIKTKFASNKAKTIDFPDLLQSALESTSNQKTKNTLSNGKPIQSILRRSETPPTSKNTHRQQSVESNESTRETSIEKLLRTTSTSRPLMFNN